MKTLINIGLWFCAATMLAQATIISLSFMRGNFNGDTIQRVIATLNGIDIQGERLKNALIEAKDAPVPTHEEVLGERAKMSLELDARDRALARYRDQLELLQTKLQNDTKELDRRRESFDMTVAQRTKTVNEETLGEVRRILEIMQPEQAKDHISRMIKDGSSEDVVAIVKALPDDKRKKIIAEFTQEDEAAQLAEILKMIRDGVGLGKNPAGTAVN